MHFFINGLIYLGFCKVMASAQQNVTTVLVISHLGIYFTCACFADLTRQRASASSTQYQNVVYQRLLEICMN